MYLHNDKDLFTEVITEANAQTGIAESIIEKDYYVTMILKLLAKSNPDIVFKGGEPHYRSVSTLSTGFPKILISPSLNISENPGERNSNTISSNRSVMSWVCPLRTGTVSRAIRITTITSLAINLQTTTRWKASCPE